MFAEVLFAAIAIVSPAEGEEVAVLSGTQKSYLALPWEDRAMKFDDRVFREELARTGDLPCETRLEWKGDTNAVYSLTVDGRVFEVTNSCSARIVNLEPGRKYRWSVSVAGEDERSSVDGSFRTAADLPRLVFAEGVRNLRDLGGWETEDGRRVRFGRIFRSAGLRGNDRRSGGTFLKVRNSPGRRSVTPLGLRALSEDLGIRTDLELRPLTESRTMKTTIVLGASWSHIPFAAYGLVEDPVIGRRSFARIFRMLLDENAYPVLFHCADGRDRTGTLAFILNALLGVGEDDLRRDWEANAFVDASTEYTSEQIMALFGCLSVYPGDDLNERAEGYARYCGITDSEIARFRGLMLEGGGE